MASKYRSIQRTMLPLEYQHVDRSSAKAFYEWKSYIRRELQKDLSPMMFFYVQAQKILHEKSHLNPHPNNTMPKLKKPMSLKTMFAIQIVLIIILLACIYYQMEVKNG